MSTFKGYTKANVTLNNGMTLDVYTSLKCEGDYHSWREDMHPDGLGYYMTFAEIDYIDEDSIEPTYPEDFEPVNEDYDEEKLENTYITQINSYEEPDEWDIAD